MILPPAAIAAAMAGTARRIGTASSERRPSQRRELIMAPRREDRGVVGAIGGGVTEVPPGSGRDRAPLPSAPTTAPPDHGSSPSAGLGRRQRGPNAPLPHRQLQPRPSAS